MIATEQIQISEAIKIILDKIAEPSEGISETPQRVERFYREFFNYPEPKITVFSANGYDEMIVDKGIPYYTFCEHHILPFFGTVKIGYIPDKKIIGLSKLARIVKYFSRRLNTQEYFTKNIADYLQEKLAPKGVGVIVTGRHLCKEMRGIESRGEMITSALERHIFNRTKSKRGILKTMRYALNIMHRKKK